MAGVSTGVSLLGAGRARVNLQDSLYAYFDFNNNLSASNNGIISLPVYTLGADSLISYPSVGGNQAVNLKMQNFTSSNPRIGFSPIKPIIEGQTLCGWMRRTSYDSIIFSRIRVDGDTGTINCGDGSTGNFGNLPMGDFVFVAAKIREGSSLITVNNTIINQNVSGTFNFSTDYYSYVLSNTSSGSYLNVEGVYDSMCIYDRELNDEEISSLYNAGSRMTYSQLLSVPIQY